MEIQVDRRSSTPLYQQISRAVRDLILRDALPSGFRLPPERALARSLGVNRTTVMNAYADLKAEGLVHGRVGDGTRVVPRARLVPPLPAEVQPLRWGDLARFSPVADEGIRELMALAESRDTIMLSLGFPALDLLPAALLGEALAAVLAEAGPAALHYAPAEGLSSFREAVARLMGARGANVGPDEILVTSGSHQALDLVARTFLDPGDTVVVEEPTYLGALQVFRAAHARLVSVPVDAEGLRTDLLEAALSRSQPKFIYTLPTFQNPSGRVMSLERRERLLDLAYRFRVPLLEDDIYGDLWYVAPPPPSLKALDRHGYVIHASSFSKLLAPGLRVGWIAAPRPVIGRLAEAKQIADLQAPTLSQLLVERVLGGPHYVEHAAAARRTYGARRDAMARALERHARDWAEWTTPTGGFYFWCRVTAPLTARALAARAAARGVSILPGNVCLAQDVSDTFVRLSFSSATPEQIEEGIGRLARAVRDASGHRHPEADTMHSTRPVV
jgi:DNA-binding transcriptional MocR family regulator